MSMLKKLAGQTALYGLSSIIGRTLNFLLVPFYTSVLFAEEFGAMTELYAIVAFLNVIYLFGLETAYFRFSNKEGIHKEVTFNNTLSSILITSFLFSGIIILFSKPIADILKYRGNENYIIWLALILALDAIANIPFARLRLENKAGKFAFAKLFNISVNIGFNLFFLIFCRKVYLGKIFPEFTDIVSYIYNPERNVEYILISNFIASLVTLPFLFSSFRGFKFSFTDEIKRMIPYSIPMMFIGLAGMIDEMLSRVMLKHWLPEGYYTDRSNLEALGIFGACYKLSMFMSLGVQAFRYAADPFFFSRASDKKAPELFARVMKWFVIACCFIYLGVSANLSIFKLILRKEIFREAILVVPVLLMANLFLGIYYNLSMWYKLTDKTHLGTIISIAGAFITIIFNLLLIPYFGYMGSAATTLICYFFMSALSYYWGKKYYPIPYKLGSAFFYISTVVLLSIAALLYPFGEGTLLSYAYQFCLIILFILIVFLKEKKEFNFKAS
ncbi:MAG: lipopolysaccharide biosynthesis protein [Cytophagaceae bacterium]